jgi:FkbM family methyltransferase
VRALSLFDGPMVRKARFEALAKTSEVVLAENQERFLVFTRDKIISKTVYATGEFEFDKFQKARGLLGEAFSLETLVDVGANLGTISIPAVHRGLARRAIAIEPEPRNFELLEMNVHLNGVADRFTLHNLALGAADGQQLSMELSGDNSGDHRIRVTGADGTFGEGGRNVIHIKSETLDTVVGPLDPRRALVWMDTQGYEGHVLKGAAKMLAARVPLVMEVWPYGMERAGSYAPWRAAIASYGSFYDLSERAPAPQPLANIDALYDKLTRVDYHSDVLLT